jgi:predicted negative regulator of RcsB-dependent stress response
VRAVADEQKQSKSKKRGVSDEGDETASHESESSGESDDQREKTHVDEESSEERDDEASDEDESDEEKPEGENEPDDEESEEGSEEGAKAAHRVASALGVAGDEAEGAEGEPAEAEEAAPLNRAARRAEAAQRRKKRKAGVVAAPKSDDPDDDTSPVPKDKNARAKELLKRRREQAAAAETRPIQLLPGEMVDDALARSSSAVGKWIRENFGMIQWVILAGLAAGGGYLFYQSRVDKRDAGATASLMAGVRADHGRVMAEDKRPDDEKELDPTKVFKTAEERTETALAAYKKTATEHSGSAAAILARLGEAGDYLDKGDWAHALDGFSSVASSTLAGADPDVKARALEGVGFAKEGKGDLDGALSTYKDLEAIDARGFKELALYHQGRLWLAKGDKDKAKDFLKQAHDKLEQPTTDGPAYKYLQQMTDELLRRIDPSLVPAKAPAIGGPKGGSMTADEIEKLKRQIMESMKQKEHH